MSRIYSKLQEIEVEKWENVNRRPLLNALEKRPVSPRERSDVTQPAAGIEGMGLSAETNGKSMPIESDTRCLVPAFDRFANHVKNTLGSIRTFTESSQGRFKDAEFGKAFHQKVTEDIDRTCLELDCLLDYIRIKSPDRKTDVVRSLLEEFFQRHGKRLREKDLRIVRRQFQTDLPETGIPDDQLRYILNWVLHDVILSATPGGNLGILTRSCIARREVMVGFETWIPAGERYVEIVIVFTHLERPRTQNGRELGSHESAKGFIFPLVEQIIRENHGIIKFKTHQEKHVTQVSLMLPAGRKNAIHSN